MGKEGLSAVISTCAQFISDYRYFPPDAFRNLEEMKQVRSIPEQDFCFCIPENEKIAQSGYCSRPRLSDLINILYTICMWISMKFYSIYSNGLLYNTPKPLYNRGGERCFIILHIRMVYNEEKILCS